MATTSPQTRSRCTRTAAWVTRRFELVRLTPDGALDPGFGAGGRFQIPMGPWDEALDLAVQPDGKIVVAGSTGGYPNHHVAVVRVDPDGTSPYALAPPSLDFGGQSKGTTSPPLVATLRNTSASVMTVADVYPTPGGLNAFAISHDCGSLAPGASCTLRVSFTPVSPSVSSASIVIVGSGGAAGLPVTGQGETTLTTHYYRSILRRDPDAGGKAFWDSEVTRLASANASRTEVWFAMAMAFYGSAEYGALGRDDAGFVTDLYKTFFNREPDPGGREYWVGQLQGGLPREVLLAGFIFSPEFVTFIDTWYPWSTSRPEVAMVMDFYRGLLARLPDGSGLSYWVARFQQAQCQGAAAVRAKADAVSGQFLGSAEYAGRGRTDAQFVADLYNAFLRRGGDLGGVLYWIGQLGSGARSREDVRRAFVASPEFAARVEAVANASCITP